jgi:hypothetical protein
MNWTDPSDGESIDDDAIVVPDDSSPFSGQRRTRVILMSLVTGGGLCLIVVMRLLSGGPAAATAEFNAEQEISGYLSPADPIVVTMSPIGTDDPLRILARSNGPKVRVPLAALKGNPFVLPGRLIDAPIMMSQSRINEARDARITEMRSRISEMRVSMVLRGRHSVAVVGDISLPLQKNVELDERTTLQLLSLDGSGVLVQATDSELDVSVEVELPRP